MPLVLVAVFGLIWLLTAGHRSRLGLQALSVRGTFVVAFLLFEVLQLAVTELTSVGDHFTAGVVTSTWAALLLLLLIAAWPFLASSIRGLTAEPRKLQAGIRARIRSLGVENTAWLLVILAIFGVLVAIGWLYPPNNGDSMVYHLARVEHWLQNGTVAPYATHYLAQIELSPLHEYNLANLHLLSGGDRLDGYVQLLAALTCAVGVSEMARLLHGTVAVQVAAAVLCMAIPSGLLEATSTENNYFAAAIGVALLLLLMAWAPGHGWPLRAVVIGLAGGLTVMAKGTLLALIGPAAVLLALVALRREWRAGGAVRAARRAALATALAVVCAIAVAGPFEWQNVQLFGGPLGPVSKSTLSTHLTAQAAAANVIRSTAGNFLIGGGPGGIETDLSKVILSPFEAAFERLSIAPDDQNYALGTDFRAFTSRTTSLTARDEDFGANPWHVLLLLAAGIGLAAAVMLGRGRLRTALLLAIGLSCGFVLFTATARWSVFNVRYQLPLLVAWCPLIAVALGLVKRFVRTAVLIAIVVVCTPQLFDNATRSLLHPSDDSSSPLAPYFPKLELASVMSAGPVAYTSLTGAIAESSCHAIGLANWVLVEYPLWVGLHQHRWTGTLEDVDVMNESSRLEVAGYRPCVWIRQEPQGYVAPSDGAVHLQFGNLALAVSTPQAATISTAVAGFASQVDGVRILPGGGWSLAAGGGPAVTRAGSVYLFTGRAQRVEIIMQGPSTAPPMLSARDEAGGLVATGSSPSAVEFTVDLSAGVTSLQVDAETSTPSAGPAIQLTSVTVVGAPTNG